MSYKLPKMPFPKALQKNTQTSFGGYNHVPSALDGDIYDMTNLASDNLPLLSCREKRSYIRTLTKPNGLYGYDVLSWVDGTGFYYNGVLKGTVDDSKKTFTTLGAYIIILPDKKYYNTVEDEFGSLESTYTSTAGAVSFCNGESYGEPADANTLTTTGESFSQYFSPGDAIIITGCTTHTENNKIPVIREISEDGKSLSFYEGVFTLDLEWKYTAGTGGLGAADYYFLAGDDDRSFTLGTALTSGDTLVYDGDNLTATISGTTSTISTAAGSTGTKLYFGEYWKDYTEPGAVTLKREVPDLDYICECDNRLWGCKGDTIYASKQGNVFNWNVFDGLGTDSYAVNVGSEGDFTGCFSFLGYPTFFKETNIYKIYGTTPANYSHLSSAKTGVMAGSVRSLAVSGETLFYLSKNGVIAYNGGIPQVISSNFGSKPYKNAVAGTDGQKYYISVEDDDGNHPLFVYNVPKGVWCKEDNVEVISFAATDRLYMLTADGKIWTCGNKNPVTGEGVTQEASVSWEVLFGPFIDGSPNKKAVANLQLRVKLNQGTIFNVWIKPGTKPWKKVKELTGTELKSEYLPTIPVRCDSYQLKLTGSGGFILYSLGREMYHGSAK